MPVDPYRSLELAAPRQEALCRAIESLSEAQWQTPSNCAGWAVADLVAHVTRNGESVLLATRRALSGDSTPAFGPTMRPREEALRASGAQACAALQRTEFAELRTLVGDLKPNQLELTFQHPMGPRPVAWYCTARLSEVAFHRWDLGRSLGHDEPLDGEAAAYLLDYLLDSSQPIAIDRRAERTAED
ncbi:MAG: maleylpyruvate isomerase family mycothiol-dependent enzyme, partial [Chloroflexota bacterium]